MSELWTAFGVGVVLGGGFSLAALWLLLVVRDCRSKDVEGDYCRCDYAEQGRGCRVCENGGFGE